MCINSNRRYLEQIQNKGAFFFPKPGVLPYPPADETSGMVPVPGPSCCCTSLSTAREPVEVSRGVSHGPCPAPVLRGCWLPIIDTDKCPQCHMEDVTVPVPIEPPCQVCPAELLGLVWSAQADLGMSRVPTPVHMLSVLDMGRAGHIQCSSRAGDLNSSQELCSPNKAS